jgi:hypothetical protein
MNKNNLVASFEVRSYMNGKGGEIVQLIIHGKQVVAQAKVSDTLYEKLFDSTKSKISNAGTSPALRVSTRNVMAKPKLEKVAVIKVKPPTKKRVVRKPRQTDDWGDDLVPDFDI